MYFLGVIIDKPLQAHNRSNLHAVTDDICAFPRKRLAQLRVLGSMFSRRRPTSAPS